MPRPKHSSNDGLGGRPITPGYVDNVNAIIPVEDVELFLESFRRHAEPLGATMNAQKTRILILTSGESVFPALRASAPDIAASLNRAINKYSLDGD